MTSTSFNPIQMNATNAAQNQPLVLREGQVFHGTIKQLYPDQMAEVQIGSNKLVAKLETPLKVGDAHFFQVTNTGAQTELKVVSGPMTPTMTQTQQTQQLLQSMNLPKSNEMQQLASHFMKEQVPISREQLLQGEVWLKNLPANVSKQEALVAMQRMVELKMPFTQDVFQALTIGAKTDGMSASITQLMNQLSSASINDTVKTNLMQQLDTLAKPLQNEVGGLLLAKAVQILMDDNASIVNKQQMLQLLKESNVLQPNASLNNWQNNSVASTSSTALAGQLVNQLFAMRPEQSTETLQQLKQFIQQEPFTAAQKDNMLQLIERFEKLPQTKQTIDIFARQLQEQFVKAYANNQQNEPFSVNSQGISTKEQLLSLIKPDLQMSAMDQALRQIAKAAEQQPALQLQAEAQVQAAVDSKAMEQAMKTVLKALGLSYEATLGNKASDVQTLAQQLKPQLHALLNDAQLPPALRESAEQVMAKLNGMQLLSGENGHQHQLVMQVPLQFFGKKMDATLQWNGRMKEDGKIDANFARILFYLNMESMQETVIDMQVQNRIVTIQVFNNDAKLVQLAEPLKEALKQGLAEKEYHLSGVFVKPFEQKQVSPSKKEQQEESYSGVDIRV